MKIDTWEHLSVLAGIEHVGGRTNKHGPVCVSVLFKSIMLMTIFIQFFDHDITLVLVFILYANQILLL